VSQQLEQAMGLLNNVQSSMDAQELRIKAYEAETKRIAATSAGMSTEQIQDIVMGTIAAAVETGDISGNRPMMPQMPDDRGAMGAQEEQMGPME
jgi:hypothetical protein